MEKPAPPPEAVLLAVARKAAGLKTPEAARAAGVSKARLSQIESGYERRAGRYSPVRGKDDTIAHIAGAVGVSPERLEEAGRPDAALVLREILRRDDGVDAVADLITSAWGSPDYAPELVQRIWRNPRFSEADKLSLIQSVIDGGLQNPGNPGEEQERRRA